MLYGSVEVGLRRSTSDMRRKKCHLAHTGRGKSPGAPLPKAARGSFFSIRLSLLHGEINPILGHRRVGFTRSLLFVEVEDYKNVWCTRHVT